MGHGPREIALIEHQSTAPAKGKGESIRAELESFTTPGTHYDVTLYCNGAGEVKGGSCSCPAHVAPFGDKHVILARAERYGTEPPRGKSAGRFVTERDLDQLVELTGISYFDLSQAFTGERFETASAVIEAALVVERSEYHADAYETAERWGAYCRGWAKRFGRGQYHPAMNSDLGEVA